MLISQLNEDSKKVITEAIPDAKSWIGRCRITEKGMLIPDDVAYTYNKELRKLFGDLIVQKSTSTTTKEVKDLKGEETKVINEKETKGIKETNEISNDDGTSDLILTEDTNYKIEEEIIDENDQGG